MCSRVTTTSNTLTQRIRNWPWRLESFFHRQKSVTKRGEDATLNDQNDDGETKTILEFIALYLPSLSHMSPCHRNNLTFLIECIFVNYMPKIHGSIYRKYRQIASVSSVDSGARNVRSIFKIFFTWMFKFVDYISHTLYTQSLSWRDSESSRVRLSLSIQYEL